MSFVDCLVLTLFNALICISLPKVLSLISTSKPFTTELQPVLAPKTLAKSRIN